MGVSEGRVGKEEVVVIWCESSLMILVLVLVVVDGVGPFSIASIS